MLRHEAEKQLMVRKTSPYRLRLYDNPLIVLFPAIFVLNYCLSLQAPDSEKWSTMAASSVAQLLCNLWYFGTQAIALGVEII